MEEDHEFMSNLRERHGRHQSILRCILGWLETREIIPTMAVKMEFSTERENRVLVLDMRKTRLKLYERSLSPRQRQRVIQASRASASATKKTSKAGR